MRLPGLLLTAALLAGTAVFGIDRFRSSGEESGGTTPVAATQQVPALPPAASPDPAPPPTTGPEEAPTPPAPDPQPQPPAAATPAPLPASAKVGNVRHEYQRLNNCGPVTVGMALSRWGSTLDQYDIAPRLKPTAGDVNVSPDELAGYARSQGMKVHLGVNGDRALLKRLLAAGFPVIVETWFVTHDSGGMGHYRLLTGYDDAAQSFGALDSYLGPLKMPYARFDELWRSFGRTFLVVHPPARVSEVTELLGARADAAAAKQDTLRAALAEAERRGDAVGWLNLGHAKLGVGDARGAARAFDQAFAASPDPSLDPTRPARVVGGLPWRALWYSFGPLEAYTRTGRYADVLRLTAGVLRDAPAHEEAHYWRGRALSGLGRAAEAQAAYREALRLRPGYAAAREALVRL
ncbi:C39 family peptidase [Deinococcus budaensis]|uniref:Tetratricopeptide (TPR) repeat protein n=1 Tax=Deinococcus budaensis TaxID=1665626 RepID=A0A7W8GG50_9DEIO|nr:C39 family peptidase [Deinococcus budaensis]MBB5235059.1 tetratricopeptide (TPR) repeat protein [Deinococcus budaensis]